MCEQPVCKEFIIVLSLCVCVRCLYGCSACVWRACVCSVCMGAVPVCGELVCAVFVWVQCLYVKSLCLF